MSATIASTLIEIIATAQQELGKIGGAAGSSKKGGKTAAKKESTRKGRPTPHGDFTKKILEEHKAEKDAFIAERVAKAAAGELLYAADDAAVKKGKHAAGDAYTEEEAKKGAHLNFIAFYKGQHKDEYTAFEATWREAHPKEATSANESEAESATDGASIAESQGEAASTSSKPKRVMSDEQKAKMKAGREKAAAAKKAAKAAGDQEMKDAAPLADSMIEVAAPKVVAAPSTPVAAPKPVVATPSAPAAPKKAKKAESIVTPVATVPAAAAVVPAAVVPAAVPVAVAVPEPEEDSNELIPFKYAGANYLRIGTRRADGNHIWATGDLWASNKGARGKYIGCLSDDNKSIDRTTDEPEIDE